MTPAQRREFIYGCKEVSHSAVTIVTWSVVTGIAMAKSTLTIQQAIAMSLFVYAGSAQLAALPLIAVGTPIWVILLTSFMVNLRFVIFSLGLQAHFSRLSLWRRTLLGYFTTDFSYLAYLKRFPKPQSQVELAEDQEHLRMYSMIGFQAANWTCWQIGSITGILLASQIPNDWGLGFAGAVALIVIIGPMLDRASARWAAVTAGVIAVMTYGMPFRLNIILAIISALVVGMILDQSPKESVIS
jgi:predicted branched-subunit amino acid permease